ncbi:MAG: biopolymer transporter ExbD [Nitrospiraceae bacterium]|nr:biopolymer transporter ExbD [Nitrospiraceae bacterium]
MLVIFLAVTTNFLSGGKINVKLPKGGASIEGSKSIVEISMDKWGKVYINGKLYKNFNRVVPVVKNAKKVFIEADRDTPYVYVFSLLDVLRKANIRNISLVGERVE